MKINELVEFVGNSKNKFLKPDQLLPVVKKEIETKDYLGIKEKKELIDTIINECILYEDGVFKFDDIEKYICFTMMTIAAYTNLELSADIEDDYDDLCRAQLLNVVIDGFIGEYENVRMLFQMKCEDVLGANRMEAQFGRFLNRTSESIDKITEVLAEQVKSFDFSNLPIDSNDITKIMEFVDLQKK